MIDNQPTRTEIKYFLNEDIGSGDVTANLIANNIQAKAQLITRERMVLCGQNWFDLVFTTLNSDISIHWLAKEGAVVEKNSVLCYLTGSAKDLLTGERTALNLLQTLSYTASVARLYAEAVAGTQCQVLDTRKTIPGLRKAQKYAVTCGGCVNHRKGLYDGVLIKENHITAIGSIALAISAARKISNLPIEVEVESLAEYQQALNAKPDRIMLDNFSVADLKTAVSIKQDNIKLEASGNITLANIREIAETGIDFISIGALTKQVKAIDLSMRITLEK